MQLRLLGPSQLWANGRTVPLGGPKQRALLALLALRAGEVVPRDRLIEALWGEAPHAGMDQRLYVQISRLRTAMREGGADPSLLERVDGGYRLRLAGWSLDVHEAERLVEEGRCALAEGRAEEAAETLGAAVDLWRGPPLTDLADDPGSQGDVRRLEELRVAALEDRLAAELALGRDSRLVPDLRRLVAEYPLRERLCGQLMLALYRCGRQREALDAYRDLRRDLVEQLGIEPGPELRELQREILTHDSALAAGPTGPRLLLMPKRARRLPIIGATAIGLAAAVVAVGLLVRSGDDDGPAVPAPGNSLAAIDSASGRVAEVISVGRSPVSVTVGGGAVWVLNADDRTISRIGLTDGSRRVLATGTTPTDLAAGAGALWVGASGGGRRVGAFTSRLLRLDLAAGTIRGSVALPRGRVEGPTGRPHQLAVARDAVWAVGGNGEVSRIDRAAGRVTATVPGLRARSIALGGDSLWALRGDGAAVVRVNTRTARAAQTVKIAATRLDDISAGAGAVWAADSLDGTLWRIDPGPRPVTRTIPVGVGADAVAAASGAVWVLNSLRGTIVRLDPVRNRVVRTTLLGGTPRALAVGGGRVWVAIGGDAAPGAAELPVRAGALPGPPCGRVLAGGRSPDLLIASDLPLQGGLLQTEPMANAVAFVLRQHRFRAGRFSIGYQSCDDSTAESGISDPRTCEANAKAFGRVSRVIGVVGPYDSGCAAAEIPILGRAPGGPLALVSPTNSDIGLTRRDPLGASGSLARLYPSGVRNYARVYPTDAAEGAADAELARRLGLRRLAVLDDGEPHGRTLATFVSREARRGHLRVVLRARWRPGDGPLRAVADRVARVRADGVFLGGALGADGGRFVRLLRARLGTGGALIAPASFGPLFALWDLSGGASRGMYVSTTGLPVERLPAAGRRFARAFEATQPGVPVDAQPVYAAQATEVLLGAIARSNGTRSSVTRQLLATRIRNGLLGSFRIDRSGDSSLQPVTILRVRRRTGVSEIAGFEGGAIRGVIVPAARPN